jgi:hypothetical protein
LPPDVDELAVEQQTTKTKKKEKLELNSKMSVPIDAQDDGSQLRL